MRVDALHQKICRDVQEVYPVVSAIFPATMPAAYQHKPISIRNFVKKLNTVTEDFGLFNEIKEDKTLDRDQIFMTGLWLAKEELPENGSRADIRIIWHLHPDTKRFEFNQPSWNRRRYYFWQMFFHELIHRYQDTYRAPERDIRVYRPRTTMRDTKEEQEYYGNYDEIEAHSHNAAMEFFLWWGHLSLRDAIYEAQSYTGRMVTPTYNTYHETFCDTPNHPAMKHFKRKLRVWYAVVKKNPDWYLSLGLPNLVSTV